MANKNISFTKGNRVVVGESIVDLYITNPLPVTNITSITTSPEATTSSGQIYISSYLPYGIDILNRWFGETGSYDLTTSGFTRTESIFAIDLLRPNIPISGSKMIKI